MSFRELAEELCFQQAATEGDNSAILMYADWLEERSRDADAAWLRRRAMGHARSFYYAFYGSGDGSGDGFGSGDGSGYGYGSGDGYGSNS